MGRPQEAEEEALPLIIVCRNCQVQPISINRKASSPAVAK
jgi:hypothetical protein